jgi:hypothetical protein
MRSAAYRLIEARWDFELDVGMRHVFRYPNIKMNYVPFLWKFLR